MDTQQLKYFLQLCVDKNYATAADKLYITQQALRKSMKRIELEMGISLFYRRDGKLELTRAGECVKSHARNIIDEMDTMERSLAELETDRKQTILIASSYGVYPLVADRLISSFGRKYPAVKIKMLELPDAKCEEAIKNGDVDLGFCIGPNDDNYFEIYELEAHDICAMVNKSNPLSKREYLTLNDLEGQNIAISNENFKIHQNLLKACSMVGFEPNIALNGGDVISVQNFSRFDKNISVTVDFLARDMTFDESALIPIKAQGLNWTVNMLYRRGEDLGIAAEEFVEFAKRVYGL